jgi:hypothetical protein
VRMNQQTYQTNPAVLWEFTYSLNGEPRHVKILYWNANGTQFDVYASAPAASWTQTAAIFDAMVAGSAVH